jgi:membrane protease YdiL (CAAX protease family)
LAAIVATAASDVQRTEGADGWAINMSPLVALQSGILLVIVLASVALWSHIFALRSAGRELLPYERRNSVPWGGRDVALVALAVIVLPSICAWFFQPREQQSEPAAAVEPLDAAETSAQEASTAPTGDDETQAPELKTARKFATIISGAVGSLLALGVAGAWLQKRGAGLDDLGFNPLHTAVDIKWGIAGFVAASIPVFVIQFALVHLIPYTHPVGDIFQAQPGVAMLVATAILAVVVAPLTEEFFFRVVLQGWLEALYAERGARYASEGDVLNFTSSMPASYGENESDVSTASPGAPDAARSMHEQDAPVVPALIYSAGADAPAHESRPSLMPVLLSSFVFALVHLEFGPSAVPLFFFALILGYLYRQTHRLLPSLVTHACLNALSVFIMVTSDL